MNIGAAGIALIKSYEKCVLRAYMPTPDDVPTIGWGSTKGVKMGDVMTQEEADAAFLLDQEWTEACVNRVVTAALTQNEYDALCSLCFNIGCTAFTKSTLVKLINEHNFDAAALQFAVWNRQNHKVLAGLTRRRAEESQLFEKEFT